MLRLLLPLAFCLAVLARLSPADDLGVCVPEGFEISLYADDTLAHDIFSMTLDAQGRVVVAGRDYVKTLHDDDGDGRADRATLYSEIPASGAHGMYFDGPDLVATGDDSLMRLGDRDGDGRADGEPEIWTRLRNPEHGANGIVRGPDGCYYVVCGNTPGSPRGTPRWPLRRSSIPARARSFASRPTVVHWISTLTGFAIRMISTSTPWGTS